MMTIKRRAAGLVAGIAALAVVAGCDTVQTDQQTGQRAGTGAAMGAAAGAALGIATGSFLTKTIAGAAIGGAGGFIYDQATRERTD
jgi:osmotically inducible lipoprotein OsmB